jgi:hypothetical protein
MLIDIDDRNRDLVGQFDFAHDLTHAAELVTFPLGVPLTCETYEKAMTLCLPNRPLTL